MISVSASHIATHVFPEPVEAVGDYKPTKRSERYASNGRKPARIKHVRIYYRYDFSQQKWRGDLAWLAEGEQQLADGRWAYKGNLQLPLGLEERAAIVQEHMPHQVPIIQWEEVDEDGNHLAPLSDVFESD